MQPGPSKVAAMSVSRVTTIGNPRASASSATPDPLNSVSRRIVGHQQGVTICNCPIVTTHIVEIPERLDRIRRISQRQQDLPIPNGRA